MKSFAAPAVNTRSSFLQQRCGILDQIETEFGKTKRDTGQRKYVRFVILCKFQVTIYFLSKREI